MNENVEIKNEENLLSDVIFALLPENNIITNRAFLYAFNGNFLKASMLSRYTHCFINNGNKEITYKDKTFEEQYYCSEISVKRAKKELKEDGFITVVQKGIPAIGYITVNIEKVAGILGNFKKYQNDTTGDIDLIPLYNNRIKDNKNIKENTKRNLETEKNIPASGSPSSPKVDELRLAEENFENRFWVLVQNKVGKEQAKQRFFQITNNCKNEKKVNEVIEGYKRYLSFLAKNKANNFNRRPKDPATFLNIKNKLWLEPWEFVEDEVVLNVGGSRIKQPENWKNRISIAKRLGLLENFEREEINDMYDKEWKFIPNEAKQAIASEKVDVEYKERVEQKRKREIELKEKTLKKREKEVECQNLGEKLKQLEFEIKKPFLSWIEETFDLSSLIKDFKTHMFLKLAVPENMSEFSMLEFYKDELWISSEVDRMLEEKFGDDKEFVEKKHEYENDLKKYDEEFKKHRELVKELADLDKDITNLALEHQKLNN